MRWREGALARGHGRLMCALLGVGEALAQASGGGARARASERASVCGGVGVESRGE